MKMAQKVPPKLPTRPKVAKASDKKKRKDDCPKGPPPLPGFASAHTVEPWVIPKKSHKKKRVEQDVAIDVDANPVEVPLLSDDSSAGRDQAWVINLLEGESDQNSTTTALTAPTAATEAAGEAAVVELQPAAPPIEEDPSPPPAYTSSEADLLLVHIPNINKVHKDQMIQGANVEDAVTVALRSWLTKSSTWFYRNPAARLSVNVAQDMSRANALQLPSEQVDTNGCFLQMDPASILGRGSDRLCVVKVDTDAEVLMWNAFAEANNMCTICQHEQCLSLIVKNNVGEVSAILQLSMHRMKGSINTVIFLDTLCVGKSDRRNGIGWSIMNRIGCFAHCLGTKYVMANVVRSAWTFYTHFMFKCPTARLFILSFHCYDPKYCELFQDTDQALAFVPYILPSPR